MRYKLGIQSGFSLVEMLVYIALLVIIVVVAVSALLSFSEAFVQHKTEKILTRQLHDVVDKIQYDIRKAVAVNVIGSDFTVTPGTLVLDSVGSSVAYTLSGGIVTVAENGAAAVPLSGGSVTVDALTFSYFTNPATELVQVTVTATAAIGSFSKTETYQTSAVLRGSYE